MQMAKVCIRHSSAEKHLIFKVFVPTAHNSLLIMGVSDNKFEDYLPWSRDMTKTRACMRACASVFVHVCVIPGGLVLRPIIFLMGL